MMPKPFANQPGSGMHFHVSLWEGGEARAACSTARRRCRRWPPLHRRRAGALRPALAALAAPTVNSYKRLVVGESLSGTSWAPAYVAHGPNNRTALVRTLPGRFEWRLPDASANPYLATAGADRRRPGRHRPRARPRPGLHRRPVRAAAGGDPRARHRACCRRAWARPSTRSQADAVLCAALGDTLAREFVAAQARRVDRLRAPRQRLGARSATATCSDALRAATLPPAPWLVLRLPRRAAWRWSAATSACRSCWCCVPGLPARLAALRHRRGGDGAAGCSARPARRR